MKGYGFSSFAKNIGTNLSGKYIRKFHRQVANLRKAFANEN